MKTKLVWTKFSVISLLIPALSLASCIQPVSIIDKPKPKKVHKFVFNKEYDSSYFLNLLRKNNDELNSKTATFYGLNLFYNQDEKIHKKNFFLENKGVETIKTLAQFQKTIINKTIELTKNIPDYLKKPEFEIKKEFEDKFLNGKSVNDVLENNNINLVEVTNQWKLNSSYSYYLEKNGNSNTLNVIFLKPSYVEDETMVPDKFFKNKPYFISIVYPKNTKINFKYAYSYKPITNPNVEPSIENAKLIYKKLEQKYNIPKTEISTSSNFFMLKVIDFSQKLNNIKTFRPKVLDLIVEKIDPWNNTFFPEKQVIIRTAQEFREKILRRTFKLDPFAKIDSQNLILDFETKFLDGKKLDEVLKNNNIFIYETWKQLGWGNFKEIGWDKFEDEKLLLRKMENNNIFLTTISKTDFILNFFGGIPDPDFEKVAFQVLVFPKDKNIVFEKNINRFELMKNLEENYLPKYKEENTGN
ncbi:hypothetical protein [Mesomycoplasma dispar]|uniref:Lipoprotein n=1 Tax=Mesomycoplasma dispar TaxID=86660 RepID=A0ABM6PRP5_9BACT|nr:hypothetical protein [Mesomycoplasma dispar]ATP59839.1 hypothetical protein CSW10_02790 [Mesomycoplasma dispar]